MSRLVALEKVLAKYFGPGFVQEIEDAAAALVADQEEVKKELATNVSVASKVTGDSKNAKPK